MRYRLRNANRALLLFVAGAALFIVLMASAGTVKLAGTTYRSPIDCLWSADGNTLVFSDHTANEVVLMNAESGKVQKRVALEQPGGLAWGARDVKIYAAESGANRIAEIDAATGKVVRRFPVGKFPVTTTVVPSRNLLLAANSDTHDVSVIDLTTGKERKRIAVTSEPFAISATPNGALAIVGNLIPNGDSSRADNGSSLSLIDLKTMTRMPDIRLPSGAVNVRGIAISPDGRWAYVVHALGRFNMPTTQLDRGWINTNALSIVDLSARKVYATMLLDHPAEGAADPWGTALSKDGRTLWITLSGTHQLARVDLAGLFPLMAGKLPDNSPLARTSEEYGATARNIWADIKHDPSQREELINDLSALHVADLIRKTPLQGSGPRGLALSPDGRKAVAAIYYSGTVDIANLDDGKTKSAFTAGPQPAENEVRKGERIFHDADCCFQHWLSCATCHPDGRSDGLNWDLLNDGIGNPKNTKSLLMAYKSGPMMAHGVRPNMNVATQAGFRFILFREPQSGEVPAVEAYLTAMRPRVSPHRMPDGSLSPAAKRGKALFDSPKTRCAECHKSAIFTDQKKYDVGTRGPVDTSGIFVTSALVEVWRTPPYLHDGRAMTIQEVITKFNKENRHGTTSNLSKREINDLAEYVLSL